MITDTIDDELDYIVFCDEVSLQSRSHAFLVAYFGAAKAAQFKIRYDMERAAGLIGVTLPDVGSCPVCSGKHYPACRTDEKIDRLGYGHD